MPYIKSHSNYVLSKRHQSVSDGTVWERDITTIGGVNQFSPGQLPIYRSSNFIITVRNDGKVSNQHNGGKWVENESGDVWTLQVLSGITNDLDEQNDMKIVLKKDYYDFRDFVYYGSLSEFFRASINDIFSRFPGELYVTKGHIPYYTESFFIDFKKETEEILFDETREYKYVSNPYGIDIHSSKKPINGNPLKYFADDGYKNYRIKKNDEQWEDIEKWETEYYDICCNCDSLKLYGSTISYDTYGDETTIGNYALSGCLGKAEVLLDGEYDWIRNIIINGSKIVATVVENDTNDDRDASFSMTATLANGEVCTKVASVTQKKRAKTCTCSKFNITQTTNEIDFKEGTYEIGTYEIDECFSEINFDCDAYWWVRNAYFENGKLMVDVTENDSEEESREARISISSESDYGMCEKIIRITQKEHSASCKCEDLFVDGDIVLESSGGEVNVISPSSSACIDELNPQDTDESVVDEDSIGTRMTRGNDLPFQDEDEIVDDSNSEDEGENTNNSAQQDTDDIKRKVSKITITTESGKTYVIYACLGDNNKIVYISNIGKGNDLHIRPKENFVNEFFNECDNFERLLLDTSSTPMYKSLFSIIKENDYGYYREMEEFIFPTSYGGYNLDADTSEFNDFSDRLSEIGEYYDSLFTDNLYRSMTHEAIKNFDWTYTREFNDGDEEEYRIGGEKIQKVIRLFAREFDEILSYINEIKNWNRITYDERNNLPNYFLTDTVENKGWNIKLIYPYNLDEYYTNDDNEKVYLKYDEYKELEQLENKHNEHFITRQFSQNPKREIIPYGIGMIPQEDYPYGYFMTCCENGNERPCEYDIPNSPYYFLDANGSGSTFIGRCNGQTEIRNLIKTYTYEKPYTYFDVNNEFMKRLAINAPYIWRRKGTVEGIESILGMFGLKSKRWVDRLHKGCKERKLTYDYEVIEYSSFTNKIEEEWDAVHRMYRIDWINSTKTNLNDSRLRRRDFHKSNSTDWWYTSYQGLPVAELDEEVQVDNKNNILNKPYIKISPLGSQSATSNSNEAFTRADKQNALVTRRYLYPYFTKDEPLDGNPYYQMKGGWLSNTVSNGSEVYNFQYDVDNNMSYTTEVAKGEETENGIIDNHPLFKETVRNIKRVDTIQDLIKTPLNTLKENTVYYVSNVEKDVAIINNGVYKIQYEYEYFSETQTNAASKPLMYVTLKKENGNIKVGDGTYFDETITVYDKRPKYESIDTKEELIFGDYALRETSYYLLDKEDGYEIKAYIGYDDTKTNFYFVCKDKINGAYTINSFVVLDSIASENDTNYFIIYNPYYGNRIASLGDKNGWVRLKDKDPEYVKINSIVNYNEGNNPHNGNMDYDLGHSYFLYYQKLFKTAIENYSFDKRCYENFYTTLYGEIYTYGFKNLIEDNEEIRQYAPYMLVDDKIHYFGNYYKADYDTSNKDEREGNNALTKCEKIMYYGDNLETEWRLKKMYSYLNDGINVMRYILNDEDNMINGTPYVFESDNKNIDINKIDSITNQIINNKRLTIKFYLHNEWHTNEGQTELKYLDDVVMNYLSQMIPSTAIVDVQYRYVKANSNEENNG